MKSATYRDSKMDIRLAPALQQYVLAKVRSGQFANATEMINNALLLFKGYEVSLPTNKTERAELRRQIQVGITQANHGEFVNFDAGTIRREGRRLAAQRSR